MKSLDEVIKALRCTDPDVDQEKKCNDCPYKESHRNELWCVGPSCLDEMFADALHYLKNYRDTKEWLDLEKKNYAEAIKNCERAEAKYTQMTLDMNRNDPLTWDELKGMEGKPVWVECEYFFRPQWVILTDVYDEKAMFIGDRIVDSELKEEMGNIWQAFRKER